MINVFGRTPPITLKTETSNLSALKTNSHDFIQLTEIAFMNKMYYQVSHLGHISTELAFKAVYAQQYSGVHPWGHSLNTIASGEFKSGITSLRRELANDFIINKYYDRIKTAWDMQNRYQRDSSIGYTEAGLRLVAYKEIYQWIQKFL